ncbi:MAG: glyoxylate/hydroxypyruvate reductase A [Alphaproteobacteria bacterium]|nr:glyoxylate/hydroxypyruvate reductase A [Alphaproteobacteria bacterium]
MTLIFKSNVDSWPAWRTALEDAAPDVPCRNWDDPGDDAAVEYALVWKPPVGELRRRFPNLKTIFSLGAGVDHLLVDPDLPAGIPIVRMVEPELTRGMVEYVALHVLRYHRETPLLEDQQRRREWREMATPTAPKRRVGIMGLGVIGQDCLRVLSALGFALSGWSRTAKDISGVTCHHGRDGLANFLTEVEILVCVLPYTAATENILNRDLFAQLPRGAYLINVGRGGLQDEDDILAALDSGQLAGATLDVFRQEPLPEDHAFWAHPNVTVTPHNAGTAQPWSAAGAVAANIERIRRGDAPLNIADLSEGY